MSPLKINNSEWKANKRSPKVPKLERTASVKCVNIAKQKYVSNDFQNQNQNAENF